MLYTNIPFDICSQHKERHMQLSEYTKIVQTLKQILKEYENLEYDGDRSKDGVLYVKVTDNETKPDYEICEDIRYKLEKSTNLSFFVPASVMSNIVDTVKEWTHFALRLRITSDPEQCGGRPCIRGMRIRVTDVLDLLANGLSFKDILEEMPDLNSEDIVACIKFATHTIEPPVIRKTDHPVIFV